MRFSDRWLPWIGAAATCAPGAGLAFLLATTRDDGTESSPVVSQGADDLTHAAAADELRVDAAA